MIGVSPAYYISAYGSGFRTEDILASIPRVAALGFGAIQLEIFRKEELFAWTAALKAEMETRLIGEGLSATQIVGHFLLEGFTCAQALASEGWEAGLERFLDIAASFPACGIVTIPIPAFRLEAPISSSVLFDLRKMLRDRLRSAVAAARSRDKTLALEIMPASLLGGTEGFLRLRDQPGLEALAYNFDTGHAWARKENLELIPASLGKSLAGTHLCDNLGHENRKLVPGDGSIDFRALLAALHANDYRGSLDVEVLCEPAYVDREYLRAKRALEAASIGLLAPFALQESPAAKG